MHVAEFAPDEELREKLRFEWPEETGLTLDDFEVYQMFDRQHVGDYRPLGPLWIAVHEEDTLTRRLGREWYFCAINKPVGEADGLRFVPAALFTSHFDFLHRCKGWHAPVVTNYGLTGFAFQDEMDWVLFKLWKGPDSPEQLKELLKKVGYG